jgi:hypothetical protein
MRPCSSRHLRSRFGGSARTREAIQVQAGAWHELVHATRKACASLLVALDVHRRLAMQIGLAQLAPWPVGAAFLLIVILLHTCR